MAKLNHRDTSVISEGFNLKQEIASIFQDYVRIPSYTGTPDETRVEPFLRRWFESQAYFRHHPRFWGLHPVEADPLNRHVVWGMVKGTADNTIVMIHHSDVVEIGDFETVKPFAHDVDLINSEIATMRGKLDRSAMEDLETGSWQFGRGAADMKAGGAIQMALLKCYGRKKQFRGNLVLLCLPDEENLSAGMRSAVSLLSGLKKQYGLNYVLMLNSEPHERLDPETGVVYTGSVGKIMPLVLARGSLAHVGRIFEGLNPIHLVSELGTRTEMNMALSDIRGREAAPPPSWLYLKDEKQHYDVSIPTSVRAYMSVLTLDTHPAGFLDKLKTMAEESFEAVLSRMNRSFETYLEATGRQPGLLPWSVSVKTFAQIYREAQASGGAGFRSVYEKRKEQVHDQVIRGEKGLLESSFDLMVCCLDHIPDKQPLMVIGLSPPYYPDVTNERMPELAADISALPRTVNAFTSEKWGIPYEVKRFFTGISDLSYAYRETDAGTDESIADNMPLWGACYRIPFEDIREIAMPVINIGPWGKDFHKLSERVYKRDLYEITPAVIDFVIRHLLERE